jgi:hypothetical protein
MGNEPAKELNNEENLPRILKVCIADAAFVSAFGWHESALKYQLTSAIIRDNSQAARTVLVGERSYCNAPCNGFLFGDVSAI